MLRLVVKVLLVILDFLLWETTIAGIPGSILGQIAFLDALGEGVLVRVATGVLALGVALLAIGPTRLREWRRAIARWRAEMSDQRNAQEPGESGGYRDQRSVTSHNQSGGITGWDIKVGQQPRKTSKAEADALVEALRQYPGEQFDLSALDGDADAHRVGQQLLEILSRAGWSPNDVFLRQIPTFVPPEDIFVGFPRRTPQADILAKWLEDRGWQPTVEFNEKAERIWIFVGTRS